MRVSVQKILPVLALLGVAGFLFLQSNKRLNEALQDPSQSQANETETNSNESFLLEKLREPDPELIKVISWDRTEQRIGLKRTPLEMKNQEALLPVEIVTKGTCFPGDADAIEKDLQLAPEHRLLATLENLSGGGKPLLWEVPGSLFKEGSAKTVFRVSVSEEPKQYGFYLCTANASEKSCRDKVTKDVNEIFTEHLRNDPQAGKERRNIFFQYVLLDKRGLAAFMKPPKGERPFEELKKYAQDRKIAGDLGKEVNLAQDKMKTLASYPVVFQSKGIKIELPKYNIAACAQ